MPCSLGTGALKAELIDMNLDDQDIEQRLNDSLHKPLDIGEAVPPEDIEDVPDTPCPYFACVSHPNFAKAEQLVKSLSWALQENDVEPGALLVFSVNDCQFPMILGVTMKKPVCQMLVRAILDDQKASLANSNHRPEILSSLALFTTLLEDLEIEHCEEMVVVNIHVEVWRCMAFVSDDGAGHHMLQSNPQNVVHTFEISTKKVTKNQPSKVKLPFGMEKRLKDARRANQVRKKETLKNKQPSQKKKDTRDRKKNKTSEGSTASSSDADNDNDKVSNKENGDNGEQEEEEAVVPMSSVVREEQVEANRVAIEIEESTDKRTEAAKTLQQNVAAGQFKTSFFAQVCGMEAGDVAPTSRAVCLHCKNKISKNTVRFSWYHSKIKPPAWVHSHCVYHLVKETGLEERALERLESIIADGRKKPHVHNPVAVEAQKILEVLKKQ